MIVWGDREGWKACVVYIPGFSHRNRLRIQGRDRASF